MRTVRPFNIHHAFITAEAIQPVLALARCEVARLRSLFPLLPRFVLLSRGVRLSPSSSRGVELAETSNFVESATMTGRWWQILCVAS